MKISIKKVKTSVLKEYMILINKRAVAISFTKEDAKYLVKCIRKYKGKDRRFE